jgi:hypothetical protein
MPSLGSALLSRGRNRKLRLLPKTFAKPPIASLSFAELSARASQHRDHWRRAARSNDAERLEPEPPVEERLRDLGYVSTSDRREMVTAATYNGL